MTMSESGRPVAVIVLAAGEGTRMRSAPGATVPKVMRGFAGRSMLGHVLAACAPLDAAQTIVVVGHLREIVTQHLKEIAPVAEAVIQERQDGTGHAVRIALAAIAPARAGTVVVVPGDTPLLEAATLAALTTQHEQSNAAVTLLTSRLADPSGYGRVVRDRAGDVLGVVEHKDATAEQRQIDEVASGVYAFDHAFLRDAVGQLSTDNAQGEQYLPDVVSIAVQAGRPVRALVAAADETAGVNDRAQLADAHRVYNTRLLRSHMLAGVTVIDPATTWVDADAVIEADATLLPGVQLHGTTHIGAAAVIGPDSTLTDTSVGARSTVERAVAKQATIGADVTIGPFAYLRPGTVLADEVHIGTYVELKASQVGRATKVPHLSYIGDATIGEYSNIGAATVFVNYDGVHKHRSVIGDYARTGADNMFVSPVAVGDGAYTAAGSIITEDVPPGAMAIARARQRNIDDWVARNRAGSAADTAANTANAAIAANAAANAVNTPGSPAAPAADPEGTPQS
jgi:bifunctional UDP-N-acetylglucosamine pyrophosphorylase / glucosamine-1-phosphate N-acetyltransferase